MRSRTRHRQAFEHGGHVVISTYEPGAHVDTGPVETDVIYLVMSGSLEFAPGDASEWTRGDGGTTVAFSAGEGRALRNPTADPAVVAVIKFPANRD